MRPARASRRSAARPQRGERQPHLPERLDPRVGYGCWRGHVLARAAVDPDRAKPRGVRAHDVASEAVADHDRILGRQVEGRQGRFEDSRVGLSDTDLGRDDRDVE